MNTLTVDLFRFATKESATHAIVAVHNTEINGQTVKCSWGKEAGDPANVSSQVSTVSDARSNQNYFTNYLTILFET